jgi:chromosome partitioning protein
MLPASECGESIMAQKIDLAPVVAVMNMKGGVGKTTISANLFRELYRRIGAGKKTLLIDFDAQFNLTQSVVTEKSYETLQKEKRTIWYVLEAPVPTSVFQTSDKDLEDCGSWKDYATLLKNTTANDELHLLPGDFSIAELNLRENPQSLALARRRFKGLIHSAQKECALVVLDCNPASSFLTRCAIENATDLLIPVRPDKYSVLGLKMVTEYVHKIRPASERPRLHVIFNGVGRGQSSVEAEVLANATFAPLTLSTRIPLTNVLIARPDYTGFNVDRGVKNAGNIRSAMVNAANELSKRIGLTK